MNSIIRFYYVILVGFLVALVLIHKAHAVEVSPEIGFRQSQSPNGSELDPNGAYRANALNQKGTALNNKILSDNQVTKLVPDINSVGLNFTFKMD